MTSHVIPEKKDMIADDLIACVKGCSSQVLIQDLSSLYRVTFSFSQKKKGVNFFVVGDGQRESVIFENNR